MVQEVGVQAHPLKFWFVKNPGKIPKNLGKTPEYLGKIRVKMAPNFVFKKRHPTFAEKHVKTVSLEVTPKKGIHVLCWRKFVGETRTNTFRTRLGKFGPNSFAHPKISLLLHLWANCWPPGRINDSVVCLLILAALAGYLVSFRRVSESVFDD